ncbi:MAG: Lon protease [marine bacterium B5-7]|nr:MAG: Lon protease [marine bacterium B5-7]
MSENFLDSGVYPLLPLRDVIVYPHMVIPLFVGRERSVHALDAATTNNKQTLLVAQKNAGTEEPSIADLYQVGTLANVLQLLKLPDGTVKVLVEGDRRVFVKDPVISGDFISANIEEFPDLPINQNEADVLMRSAINHFEQYIKLNTKIPPEILTSLTGIDNASRLADTIAAHLALKIEDKQQILEIPAATQRLHQLIGLMDAEIDVLEIEKQVNKRVKNKVEDRNRVFYLTEKMQAIQDELNDAEGTDDELGELEKAIKAAGMPEDVEKKAMAELKKLRMMPPMSAESTVSRNYLDVMLEVPWQEKTKIHVDLKRAKKVLDEDHYGLDKIKERILEYLAVQKRVKKQKGPVLCLVGPPGVGKTSLGQSVARAVGRKFVRMSLGGVRDEAEIRGHRRTYIGSLPGKVMQKVSKAGVKNPLFLLDEIDKMAMDFRGDPASALLEVLDPEQNDSFNDHYLEVDYDLSDVMFIATANSMDIPLPLMDRMEVIRIPGYTEDEKMHIVKRHLLLKQIKNNGLKKTEITISDSAILDVIRYYTREAGVRSLEREIAKICRKVVKDILSHANTKKVAVTARNLEKYLGVKRFRFGCAEDDDRIGIVTGLAWTQVGGELLSIESSIVPGKGRSTYTGSLGDVMQESIKAALTVVRHRAQSLGIARDFFEAQDLHVHVPEGATPKDGPSAGIGMCTALISCATHIPVRSDVAMTGEITLRGEVLAIGGLKEKLLAAKRGGIKTVIIPHENEPELKEIAKNLLQGLTIKPVKWIDEVIAIALSSQPVPLSDTEFAKATAPAALGPTTDRSDQVAH